MAALSLCADCRFARREVCVSRMRRIGIMFEFWVVLIGGTSDTDILNNAALATAEVDARMKEKDKDPRGVPPWLVEHVTTRTAYRICASRKPGFNCN